MAIHATTTTASTRQPRLLRAAGPCTVLTSAEVVALTADTSDLPFPFVYRPSVPVDDPRSAVELLEEIRDTIEAQEVSGQLAQKCRPEGEAIRSLKSEEPKSATVADLLPPVPLPPLTTAFSRRRAIFGAFALAAAPVAVLPALAAPAAVDADADLIEFAGRVAALERRCYAFSEQRSTITDQVTSTLGFGPKAPPKPPSVSGVEKIEDYQTATHRVMSISYALVEDPAVAEWEASHKAARATYKNECKALEERLGLPELDRNFDRNWRRLHRWYAQLADMHPQTLAGLAAKAEPLVMISEASSCAGSWGEVDDYAHDLALSLAHDAMRLGRGGARV